MNNERYLQAATVLLMEHYELDVAKAKALALDQKSNQSPLDVVWLACTMAMAESPWWDSEDPKVRVEGQLGTQALLLPSMEALVGDVEEALGRELAGDTLEEKAQYLQGNSGRVLAEMKGEEYVDPLEGLMNMLRGAGALPEVEEDAQE